MVGHYLRSLQKSNRGGPAPLAMRHGQLLFSLLQICGDCFAKLLADRLVAGRCAVGSVPGCLQADGERVIIAVVGYPLTADFAPEGMIAGAGETRIGLDGERELDVFGGDVEKERSIFASPVAQGFRRASEEKGLGIVGSWVV